MGALRLLLAIAVILQHYGPSGFMISGMQAVHIFFIISGFYMAMILSEKYGFDRKGLKAFYINRILRIYPTYLTVLFCAITWHFICYYTTHGIYPIPIVSFATFLPFWQRIAFILTNFTLLGVDVPLLFSYSPIHGLHFFINNQFDVLVGNVTRMYGFMVIPQAWSISAELCFYAIAPFACLGKGIRATSLGAISLFLSIFITKHYGFSAYWFWPAAFYLFAMGILSYKICDWVLFHSRFLLGEHRVLLTCLLSWIFLLFVPVCSKMLPEWIFSAGSVILVPILFNITKNNRIDRYLGNLSYPLYCVHFLMGEISRTFIGRFHISYAFLPCFVLITSILASMVLHHFIEEKVDLIRNAIALKLKRPSS